MIYGDSCEIDRVTPQGAASRLRPRLALAGGLSTIASTFPLLLFQDWRKRRKLESMRVYSVCAWGVGPGAPSPNAMLKPM